MNDNISKIKFYSFGSEKIDLSKILDGNTLDETKPIRPSRQFNEALNSVIKKDISVLDDKIASMLKDITKRLAFNGITMESNLSGNIEDIESLINKVEELVSNLIVQKENIKIGLFTSNKKLLKEKIKKLENSIEFLSKYQTEFISMKNEYNKLTTRNTIIEGAMLSEDNEDEIEKEDPIERTINFYMNKQEW